MLKVDKAVNFLSSSSQVYFFADDRCCKNVENDCMQTNYVGVAHYSHFIINFISHYLYPPSPTLARIRDIIY